MASLRFTPQLGNTNLGMGYRIDTWTRRTYLVCFRANLPILCIWILFSVGYYPRSAIPHQYYFWIVLSVTRVSLEFPYYNTFLPNGASEHSLAVGKMVLFAIFTTITTILVARVMPDAYREKKFESFFKKILLALAGTILIMVYSFHVLPVTEFVTPGTPLPHSFAPKEWFFWWLLFPMVILYFN